MKPVSSHLTSCFLHFLQCIWIKLFFKLKIEVKLTSVYHCLHVDGSLVACFPLHPHARQSKSRMTQFLCRHKQCFQGILLQPWVFLFLHKSGTRPTKIFPLYAFRCHIVGKRKLCFDIQTRSNPSTGTEVYETLNAREKVRLPWGQECSVTSEDVAGQFICVGLMKLKETGVGWFRFQRRCLYCGGVFKHLLFFLSLQKVTGWNPISLKQHFFISFCCVFNPRWWKCCCPTDWILALCSRMAVRGQGPLSEGERAQSRQVSDVKSARNLSPSLL